MSGINIRYCVDGFNNYAFDNIVEAAKYAKVADECYFYSTTNTELYDCKNVWEEDDYYDNPIQAAIKACHVFYVPNGECFTIIKKTSSNEELFNTNVPFRAGWYFYNYLISTEDFNDDCFLPLKGNEELFAKQYNEYLLPDIYNIIAD